MKKMTRNFVSISFALALCVGIVGMAFAQDDEEPAPNTWGVPSATNGTFSIGVQTVYDGFYVTSPFKKEVDGKWEEQDTTIAEHDGDDTSYLARITINAGYDNSDAPGVGYSFGLVAGLNREVNNGGGFTGTFDNPWGKVFFFDKQLTLRAGGLEELWKAWDDNWDYGNYDGGVQLNINPTALPGLNVGISLPITVAAQKADYPFKNLAAGFKLGGLIPYTTISAALKLREAAPNVTKESVPNVEALSETMDMNAALDFNFSPIQIRAELQIANLNVSASDLEEIPLTGKDKDDASVTIRTVNFQFHPRLDLSLSKIVDLGAFSLGTFAVWSWIRDDPTYVSDGISVGVGWDPSYKLSDAITASLYLEGNFAGAPLLKDKPLEEYNKVGFYIRPGLTFSIAPNATIRVRDVITFAEVGVDPKAGLKNVVQVRFTWGF
jgi:hypothetical protein